MFQLNSNSETDHNILNGKQNSSLPGMEPMNLPGEAVDALVVFQQ